MCLLSFIVGVGRSTSTKSFLNHQEALCFTDSAY